MLNITNHQRKQVKTTMRYHLTSIRMANMKKETQTNKQKITSVGKDVETLERLHNVAGIVKWYSCSRKQYGGSTKE